MLCLAAGDTCNSSIAACHKDTFRALGCQCLLLRLKAAKTTRNSEIDAFQESWDKSPMTKGSKNLKKSKNRCLSRFMGQEPADQRQQKFQEIQKSKPFKNHGTRVPGRKAAKISRNPKIEAFQESWEKSLRTKGSKNLKKSRNSCLSRFMGNIY